jgi:hypothetical protein
VPKWVYGSSARSNQALTLWVVSTEVVEPPAEADTEVARELGGAVGSSLNGSAKVVYLIRLAAVRATRPSGRTASSLRGALLRDGRAIGDDKRSWGGE